MSSIAATLTRDRHHMPLVSLNGGPFNGVDIYPDDLRHMAMELLVLAEKALKQPTFGRHWSPLQLHVTLNPQQPTRKDA
jgi:hypothetical protein